ncbi:hypothetical protein BDV26DRAFT_54796 [Aspergillus bertholletiae]|uniref:FAD-binding PCMH-type domain-containing protein n=1 Tax=Aspergillus bertholletiae TaxID=1226010 RepID=A0A5N7AYK4_9EURO|nr:hypothetical protein BDV26DRAFT_54796 [Aspergillus bertholletiae]
MAALGTFATCLLASVGGNSSLVAFPQQPNYPSLVEPYNLDLLRTPAAIVFPKDTSQVAAAVKCAVDAGIKVQAKSGGHSYGNYGSPTDGLSINLENLQHFSVDPNTWITSFGPGNRLGRVTELQYNNGGRHTPHGSTFTVGLGGHATVGGAGAASRQLGLLIDYLEEVEVVLANSSVVRASKTQHTDLFFAIRGAGSSVGIVTDFVIRTEPAPPSTISYTYIWTGTDPAARARVFLSWQSLLASGTLPRNTGFDLVVTPSSIIVSGAYFGSQAEFEALNILSHFSGTAPQITQITPYTNFYEFAAAASARTIASGTAQPSHFYAKSLVFKQQTLIPDGVAHAAFQYLNTTINGTDLYALTFNGLGGAVADVAPSDTAFVHRDTLFFAFSFGRTAGALTDTTIQFLNGLSDVLMSGHPNAYYGQYAGNVDPREPKAEAWAAYYGNNLQRLKTVKAQVDPHDVFHNLQSVQPGY